MAPGPLLEDTSMNDLSPSDVAILKTWFKFVDSDNDGRITAQETVAFFNRSELDPDLLKGVWAAADAGRQGFLGFKDFAIAMKLIGQLQKGDTLTTRGNSSGAATDAEPSILPYMKGVQDALEGREARPSPEKLPPSNSWSLFGTKSKGLPEVAVTSVIDGLKELYATKLKPLEAAHKFHDFVSPELRPSDFDAKPMVLLLGQYSTGKTTFIKSILGKSYPGSHIGPEPTTDRFVVCMNGVDERTVPGHTAAVQTDLPFSGLTKFGSAFLEKFQVAQMPHPLLNYFSFIDSPGVLSGEKQRTSRSYDFTGITEWFATKSDLILLLFDPHKLDISDEFKRVIMSLRGNYDKIRVVLNKADQMETQQLMRVYGALMWSLGKVLNTPEVARVYIGSFSEKKLPDLASTPLSANLSSGSLGDEKGGEKGGEKGERGEKGGEEEGGEGKPKHLTESLSASTSQQSVQSVTAANIMSIDLCRREQDDLLADLCDLPRKGADRKINEFIKRARYARVNAFVTAHLRAQMPMFGRPQAQAKLLKNLETEIQKVQRENHFAPGDMPNADHLREVLEGYSFDTFEKIRPKLIEDVDQMLQKDVPELMAKFRNPYT